MNRYFRYALVGFITFAIGAYCGGKLVRPTRVSKPAIALSEPSVPSDILISLERTHCYGPCPPYTLVISGDGTVFFTGSYVPNVPKSAGKWQRTGVIKSRITQEQLQQLLDAFEQADYFSLQDSYLDHDDGCPTVWTDSASAYTSIQLGGRTKRVEHYLGCRYEGEGLGSYPKELTNLEETIDRIVNTKQWLQ